MHRITMLAAALLAACATAAVAAPQTAASQAATGGTRHAAVDTNNDGAIDRTEAARSPRFAEKFDRLDADQDGRLSADERPQRKGRHGGGHHGMRGGVERLDKNADGRISRAEFDAGQAERQQRMTAAGKQAKARGAFDFAAADANRDGQLVRSELRGYHERLRPQREAEFAKRSAERFAAADINKDGRLSRLEVGEKLPRMERSFAWMDEDRDGFLSREELQPPRRR